MNHTQMQMVAQMVEAISGIIWENVGTPGISVGNVEY